MFSDRFAAKKKGAVTILFTDVVGSTAIKNRLGDVRGTGIIEEHNRVVRSTLQAFPEAQEIKTIGDSFLIIFELPSDAVKFALQLQSRFGEKRDLEESIKLRIGIHHAEVFFQQTPADINGIHVDTASRVKSLLKEDGIYVSQSVYESASVALHGTATVHWRSKGNHTLKGISGKLQVYEVSSKKFELPPK